MFGWIQPRLIHHFGLAIALLQALARGRGWGHGRGRGGDPMMMSGERCSCSKASSATCSEFLVRSGPKRLPKRVVVWPSIQLSRGVITLPLCSGQALTQVACCAAVVAEQCGCGVGCGESHPGLAQYRRQKIEAAIVQYRMMR